MTEIPPWVGAAMTDAKRRRNFDDDSELGAAPEKQTNKPAPGLLTPKLLPVTPKIKVARRFRPLLPY
jgi:hypothetical protein